MQRCMEQVRSFLHRRRLLIAWLAVVAVCILAILWVRYDLAERTDNQPVYQIVNDDYSRTVAIPASGGLKQKIPVRQNQRLYGVRVNMTTYDHAFATGTLHADLLAADGSVLAQGSMDCLSIRDNTFETIIFSEPYLPFADGNLTLHLWYEGMSGVDLDLPLGLWASDVQVDDMALTDATENLNATAALQYVVDYSGNWSARMLLVPGILILVAVAISFWLLLGKNPRPALAVLAAGGLLGCAFALVTPPLVAPDEYTHLSVAYQFAGQLLGQPTIAGDGSVLVRACDAPYFLNQTGDIGIFAYKTMGEAFFQPGGGIPDTPTGIFTDMTGRISWLYLGQTAGIALARLLGLGFFAMLLLGRLGNLLVYLLLAALAVRLAHPGHKWLFAAAALLPMSLQLAGSLSADAMVLGVVFSYTALCFALRQRAGAPWRILLLILAACVGPAKAIYLPVVLLCLLIPAAHLDWRPVARVAPLKIGPVRIAAGNLVKLLAVVLAGGCWVQANLGALLYATRDVDSVGLTRGAVALATAVVVLGVVYYKARQHTLTRRIFYGVVIAGVVIGVPVVFYNLTHMWGGLTPEDLVNSIQPNGDSIYTFSAGYLCRNLGAAVKLLLRSVPEQGALWLEGVLGTVLGEPIVYRVEVSWLLTIGLLAALAASALPAESDPRSNLQLSGRSRLGISLVALCVVGLTFFAALNWTPINYTTIFGVQGRYWLPVLPLVLLLLHGNRRCFTRRPAGRGAVYAVLCITSFVLLQGYSLYATWQVTA